MLNVVGFIEWALTHIDISSLPKDALIPRPYSECGTDKWHYLYGTVMARTTEARIKERWDGHYSKSWSKEAYDSMTKDFAPEDTATDCQGLLDAYLTSECGEKTDINANANYLSWCADKGKTADIKRDYVIGEAVFMQNSATGRMTHVGWVCGFLPGGEPLVVEARGIAYGVVVTKFSSRPWTHRGLMLNRFSYLGAMNYKELTGETETETDFALKSPMSEGGAFLYMQKALNRAGYKDDDGRALVEDGKWGERSFAAFTRLIKKHAKTEKPLAVFDSACGDYALAVYKPERR